VPAWCSAPGAEACAALVASSRVGFDARVPAAIANKTAAVALRGMINFGARLDVNVRLPQLPNDLRQPSARAPTVAAPARALVSQSFMGVLPRLNLSDESEPGNDTK
jgi:hypothetical protein